MLNGPAFLRRHAVFVGRDHLNVGERLLGRVWIFDIIREAYIAALCENVMKQFVAGG